MTPYSWPAALTTAFESGKQPPGKASVKAIRFRDSLVVVLAMTTGAVDAVTFLRLGKVFSSVITGNLALRLSSPGQPPGLPLPCATRSWSR